MTRYGFVASGGGYRSFYTEGALVWLEIDQILREVIDFMRA